MNSFTIDTIATAYTKEIEGVRPSIPKFSFQIRKELDFNYFHAQKWVEALIVNEIKRLVQARDRAKPFSPTTIAQDFEALIESLTIEELYNFTCKSPSGAFGLKAFNNYLVSLLDTIENITGKQLPRDKILAATKLGVRMDAQNKTTVLTWCEKYGSSLADTQSAIEYLKGAPVVDSLDSILEGI